MTITTIAQGTYSAQIAISNESNSANVIAAVDAAIVAGGWTQYDITLNSGATRIYRVLNRDGITYKYFAIYFDIAALKITTSTFESWDLATHTGTNEAFTYSRIGAASYSLLASDILLMVSTRWCLVQTFVRGQNSCWTGVVEVQREAAEDTAAAGFPCWAWMSSAAPLALAFPRSRSGAVGINALSAALQTPYVKLSSTSTTDVLNTSYSTYPWDTNRRIVHALRPLLGTTELHGRIIGLKAVSNIAPPYSRAQLPVDADFHYSAAGTLTDHWVLGESVLKYTPSVVMASLNLGSNTGYPQSDISQILNGGAPVTGLAYTGAAYYIGTQTGSTSGVAKADGATLSLISQVVPGTSAAVNDLAFDGRYVYASTATGLLRIDTQDNDAVTTVTTPNGSSSLFWDGTWLWAGARGSRINNMVYKIDPATFTLSATVSITNAVAQQIGGMCTDFAGNLYVVDTTVSIYKIVIATNTVSALVTSLTAAVNMSNIMFDGLHLYVGTVIGGSTVGMGAYTLAGANVYGYATHANTSTTFPTPKASIARFGYYTLVGGLGSTGNPTSSFGTVQNVIAGAYVTGFGQAYPVISDGNRLIFGTYTGVIGFITSLNHADDSSTQRGRFLLPK